MTQLATNLTASGAPIFLNELITPNTKQICDIYDGLVAPTRGETIWNCWNYVCTHIRYKRERGDVWAFPYQTLWQKCGDCEDSSFLLCSLLRHNDLLSVEEVWATLGTYGLLLEGHAWVTVLLDGKRWVMETTLSKAPQEVVAETFPHSPSIYFNDKTCVELGSFPVSRSHVNEKMEAIESFWNIKVRR